MGQQPGHSGSITQKQTKSAALCLTTLSSRPPPQHTASGQALAAGGTDGGRRHQPRSAGARGQRSARQTRGRRRTQPRTAAPRPRAPPPAALPSWAAPRGPARGAGVPRPPGGACAGSRGQGRREAARGWQGAGGAAGVTAPSGGWELRDRAMAAAAAAARWPWALLCLAAAPLLFPRASGE